MTNGFTIDCAFPSGNIIVDGIDGDDCYLQQDLRDTEGNWFYWSFRVRAAAGRRLTFHFTQTPVIGARGPAVNTLDGNGWYWEERFGPDDRAFSFDFGPNDDEVYFSFAIPYTESDLLRFLERHAANSRLVVDTLCQSPHGRSVEMLRILTSAPPEHRILVTGRHHACESMTSFALEGFLDEVLSETGTGAWFGATAEVLAIPFVDKDGVEEGDQGKNRCPHDHNRDYLGESIYPEIAAIRDLVPGWADRRLKIALDFHCPARCGEWHEHIHFVEPDCPLGHDLWPGIAAFSDAVEQSNASPLPYRASGNLRFGQRWNVADPEHQTFANWAAAFPELLVSATFEFPYANVLGEVVNESSARQFGRTLARAVHRFLAPEKVEHTLAANHAKEEVEKAAFSQ